MCAGEHPADYYGSVFALALGQSPAFLHRGTAPLNIAVFLDEASTDWWKTDPKVRLRVLRYAARHDACMGSRRQSARQYFMMCQDPGVPRKGLTFEGSVMHVVLTVS